MRIFKCLKCGELHTGKFESRIKYGSTCLFCDNEKDIIDAITRETDNNQAMTEFNTVKTRKNKKKSMNPAAIYAREHTKKILKQKLFIIRDNKEIYRSYENMAKILGASKNWAPKRTIANGTKCIVLSSAPDPLWTDVPVQVKGKTIIQTDILHLVYTVDNGDNRDGHEFIISNHGLEAIKKSKKKKQKEANDE